MQGRAGQAGPRHFDHCLAAIAAATKERNGWPLEAHHQQHQENCHEISHPHCRRSARSGSSEIAGALSRNPGYLGHRQAILRASPQPPPGLNHTPVYGIASKLLPSTPPSGPTKQIAFSGVVYILLFLYNLYPYRDNDWGWHYKNGEYLLQHGRVLIADIYTWSMSGYRWVNHEWLYDPLLYLLFRAGGFFALSLAGAVVAVVIFWLTVAPSGLSYWPLAILAFFYHHLTFGVYWQGLRPQMIGILFIVLLLNLLTRWSRGRPEDRTRPLARILYDYCLFPFFFVLWANLHGTFAIGIVIFTIFVALQYIPYTRQVGTTRQLHTLSISYACSVGATLINPFGYHVYLEALRHAHHPLLKYILEWVPVQFPSDFYVLFLSYTLIVTALFLFRRKRQDIFALLVFVMFFYLALGARRYMAVYVAGTLPYAALALASVRIHIERTRLASSCFVLMSVVCAVVLVFQKLPEARIYKLLAYNFEDYCDLGPRCSEGMTGYLKEHPPVGKGFNYYDWGGYLIGREVPAKLFIDGRMHLWSSPEGYQPFWDYRRMYYEGDISLFNQYAFDWFLIGADSYLLQKLVRSRASEIGTWTVKYEDSRAVYAVRDKQNR